MLPSLKPHRLIYLNETGPVAEVLKQPKKPEAKKLDWENPYDEARDLTQETKKEGRTSVNKASLAFNQMMMESDAKAPDIINRFPDLKGVLKGILSSSPESVAKNPGPVLLCALAFPGKVPPNLLMKAFENADPKSQRAYGELFYPGSDKRSFLQRAAQEEARMTMAA